MAISSWKSSPFAPAPDVEGDEEMLNAFGDIATTNFHPVGTARMGVDAGPLVTPDLQVRGLAGISIADASVISVIPSVNTQAPVTMLAEKAAEMILARYRMTTPLRAAQATTDWSVAMLVTFAGSSATLQIGKAGAAMSIILIELASAAATLAPTSELSFFASV